MEEFNMHYLAIMPSYICTLKCKLCIAGVPYYRSPVPTPPERVKEYIDRYFKIVTRVEKFTISGGEPLLYKQMPEILDHIYGYSSRIGMLEILTSGTVIPSEELLESAGRFGGQFRFMMDDYGPEISVKAEKVHEVLESKNIRHMIRNYTENDPHCGGWVDFGDLRQKKHDSQEEIEALYAKCTYPQKIRFAFTIHDGLMFPCPPVRRCSEMGIVSDYSEYIDLFDDELTYEQQRQKMKAILNGKSLKACAYCNGMCDDSVRFRPAEQLTIEEIKQYHKNS